MQPGSRNVRNKIWLFIHKSWHKKAEKVNERLEEDKKWGEFYAFVSNNMRQAPIPQTVWSACAKIPYLLSKNLQNVPRTKWKTKEHLTFVPNAKRIDMKGEKVFHDLLLVVNILFAFTDFTWSNIDGGRKFYYWANFLQKKPLTSCLSE